MIRVAKAAAQLIDAEEEIPRARLTTTAKDGMGGTCLVARSEVTAVGRKRGSARNLQSRRPVQNPLCAEFELGLSDTSPCRVRRWSCDHPLPLEPDVRLSPHPAQAVTKPRTSETGGTAVHPAMSLCDTGLQPPHVTHPFGPVDLVGVSRRVRGRTHGQVHVRLLFLVERFHQLSRNARPCWKSARLRGGVMLQLLSAPLQGGLGFLQRSSARHPLSVPCGIACLNEAGCRVYHVPFRQHRMI